MTPLRIRSSNLCLGQATLQQHLLTMLTVKRPEPWTTDWRSCTTLQHSTCTYTCICMYYALTAFEDVGAQRMLEVSGDLY
jgi:hypothetical protein